MKKEFNCDNCHIKFLKYVCPSTIKSKHNFCSYRCKNNWQKENLKGEKNHFYNKKHNDRTKLLISLKNSHPSKRKGIPNEKVSKKNNPAYVNGFWMVRKKHISQFKKDKCEECNRTDKLEIHHEPFMDETNALTWNGIVYTLCREHHMNRHRNEKGEFVRIYE
jgi:hypothetical protein